MTYTEVARRFLLSRIASGCRKSYVSLARRVIAAFVKHVAVPLPSQLEPHHVQEFLAERLDAHKPSTVRSERGIILSCLTWCCDQGFLPERDWHKTVPQVRTEMIEAKVLTVDQCEQLLAAAECLAYRCDYTKSMALAWVYVLLDTGLRVSELVNLRLDDCDLSARVLRVSAESKTRRERHVWYSTKTAARLKDYLRRRKSNAEWLWVTTRGSRPSRARVLQYVKHLGGAVGMGWLTVHTFRHTCATMLLRNGMSLDGVRVVLGHTQVRTTQRYLHLLKEDVEKQYKAASPIQGL